MFSINDIVLLWTGAIYEVGVILRKYKKRGYRVYDVAVERGSVYIQIRADYTKSTVYIDSNRTKKFVPGIQTNMVADSKHFNVLNID